MFRIFAKLGGRDAAISELRLASKRPNWPTHPTLARWAKNGELPGKVVLLLMEICERRGVAYASGDFRAGGEPTE